MKFKTITTINSVVLSLSILLLGVTQICAQGVDVSTATGTKKERKMKLISDVKIPLEGDGANYDFKMIWEKDDLQLIARRKDKAEREIFDRKGKKVRTETIKEEEVDKIVITSSKSHSPVFDGEVGNWIINFPNGVKAEVPLGHNQSISPNHKYVFTFFGSGATAIKDEDWYIRLYDFSGKALWEYSDLPHIGDFPVLWSPDGDFVVINIGNTLHLFSKNGREWSYTSRAGSPAGITIAKGGVKVEFGIRQRVTIQERDAIGVELRKRGLGGWSPLLPVVSYCLDKKGKFLWKKTFRGASPYFSDDGRFFFAFHRTTDGEAEIQIVDADNGDLIHSQILKDWYKAGERKIRGFAFDTEKKELAIFLEDYFLEGTEKVKFVGVDGTIFKGPYKRHDLGYRFVVYDLSGIFVK